MFNIQIYYVHYMTMFAITQNEILFLTLDMFKEET